MCIAILNKKDSIISDNILMNCFYNNSDGAGFMYCIDNKLHIKKGIFDIEEFLSTYKHIKQNATSDVVIHCRISTSGNIDKTNCHPHIINDNIALVHNGVSLIDVPKDSKISDTIHFINTYLKELDANTLRSKTFQNILNALINTSITNKLIIMDNTGYTCIINEDAGNYDKEGNWYSNNTYQYCYYSFYSTYKPSKKLKKHIRKNINNLSDADLIRLSDYPIVNIKTGVLSDCYSSYNIDEWMPLEDADYDLYCLYIDKLYSYNEEFYYTA